MAAEATVRREAHRLLFPIGALLAGLGVVPWIAFTLDLPELARPIFRSIGFRSLFHPLVEVQGALTCFALGYLFTALPRRTGAEPPSRVRVAAAALGPIAVAACAFLDRWALAQVVWAGLVLLAADTARRSAQGPRGRVRASPRLAWVIASVLMGLCGGVLAGLGDALGERWFWLYDLGRDLLLQGVFLGLALGSPTDLPATPSAVALDPPRAPPRWFVLHALGAAIVVGSFFVGALGWPRLGFGLRAAAAAVASVGLVRAALVAHPPGLRRAATLLARALLPLGFAWVALQPSHRRAGLHVVYLGCFAALALLLTSSPRAAGAADGRPLPHGRNAELAMAAALLAFALLSRVLLELDPTDFRLWLGAGSLSLAVAAVPWAAMTRR